MLEQQHLDRRLEHLCRRFYKPVMGRPSMPPGVYFRMLLIPTFKPNMCQGLEQAILDACIVEEGGEELQEEKPRACTLASTSPRPSTRRCSRAFL